MTLNLPWNPIPKAVHIAVERPTNTNDEELVLVAELRCGTHTISDEKGYSYEFGFNKLFVEIQTEHCKLKLGRRAGDVDKSFVVKKKLRTSEARSRSRKLKAGFGAGLTLQASKSDLSTEASVRGIANTEQNAGQQNLSAMEETIETIFHPVVSNGLNELIVQAPSGQILRGAFLYQDDLCTIIPEQNQLYNLTVSVSFQPLSVEITACASERKHWLQSDLSKNKLAFVKLLVAKYLSQGNMAPIANTLSRAATAADGYNGPAPPTDSKQ